MSLRFHEHHWKWEQGRSFKLLRVTIDNIGTTQVRNSSEKACQNCWGIFSGSEPDDGRIIWVCAGRPGQERGKNQEPASG